MSLKRIFAYALAGEEYEGGEGQGFVGMLIDCLSGMSIATFRRYSSLLKRKIQEEHYKIKGELNG